MAREERSVSDIDTVGYVEAMNRFEPGATTRALQVGV